MSASDVARFALDQAALFLDLDGTLAEIAPRPGDVGPRQRRTQLLLRAQQALGGRLAIVSGRPIADVDRILEGAVVCVAGSHGLERRDSTGRIVSTPPHPNLARAREAAAARMHAHQGLQLEAKSASFALHYRAAPEQGREINEFARALAAELGLGLVKGDHVVEIKTPGSDKGDAIAAFLGESPFAGAAPLFVGDDVTDEDGFAVVERSGGAGVLVGAPRPTAASARLPAPDAVLDWLEQSLNQNEFIVGRTP